MTNTPNYDAKVKAILDATTPGERVCALTGEKWMMTEEEIGWYRKFNVPPHPWSPFTRMKYLMGFPSGISIWKKPHAETGKEILTFIHPDSPYKIIEDREWFDREFAQEERELDSLRSFFDQFTELAYSIPVGARRDEGSSTNTVGNDVLRTVADALVESSRSTDVVARCGGDEFAVLLLEATERDAENVVNRVRQKCHALAIYRGLPLVVECRVGYAVSHNPPETADELVRLADEDMQIRRSGGKAVL